MSSHSEKQTKSEIIECLTRIFQSELSGIVRYLHYSFMIVGHHRIPIQKWLRDQAQESMEHATVIGEKLTSLGGHPCVHLDPIVETDNHTLDQILQESLEFESSVLELYKKLVRLAGDDIALEEMARQWVRLETEHVDELRKIMKKK
jgi:bacterioferritin